MKSRLRHPVRAIREPFGKAGLTVAILALVLAMVGGAWAAVGLSSKQKKEVTKIAKKYAGKPGAQGPAGPQGLQGNPGPAGAPGKEGTNGTNGTNGSNGIDGESVTITSLNPGECNNGEAGAKFTNGTGTAEACNGTSGSGGGGFPENLPSGATEMGTWSNSVPPDVPGTTQGVSRAPISFVIPLESAPNARVLREGEKETTECPGTETEPAAAEGWLCVYTIFEKEAPQLQAFSLRVGAVLTAEEKEPGGFAFGTWAVTAP